MASLSQINYSVMTDTYNKCKSYFDLQNAIKYSIANQKIVRHGTDQRYSDPKTRETQFVISGKGTFEAAKAYKGKRVAVLNFANSHSVGGAPFYAGAQEESLCRCSTLYPCLLALKEEFYDEHIRLYANHKINYMGNDDLIYTPDVVVFKTDERADVIHPKMMSKQDWYKVDVITCAAPELNNGPRPDDYEKQITSRIKQILDTAATYGAEVLILGAWGCGAFKNPSRIVARVFRKQLENYSFETVEFALASRRDVSDCPFAQALEYGDEPANKEE